MLIYGADRRLAGSTLAMKNLLSGGLVTKWRKLRIPQGLENVHENAVVPPGLESLVPLFPALKRWAKLGSPSGAGFVKLPL